MDILLIKPYSDLSNVIPPLGLGYLSAALKKKGISVKIIHCFKDNIGIPDIISLAQKNNVKIIGISCCSNDHFWLQRLATAMEGLPNIKLVVGGPHPTGLGIRLMNLISRIDFLIISEGELSFPVLVDLVIRRSLSEDALALIPNLVWRNTSGKLIKNYIELPANLDVLDCDWDALAPGEYAKFSPHGGFARLKPVAQLITTRGCPYRCKYCLSSIINGTQIRKRSAGSIINEIEYLIDRYRIKEIHIEDDNFTFYKEHVIDVCSAIRNKGIKINFGLPNGVRIDKLDDEIMKELKSAGFYFMSIGIESGSNAILGSMNKQLNLEKIKEGVRLIKKYQMRVKGFFMLGYPGETKKDMLETINFARSLPLDQAFFSVFIPLPGTPIFDYLEKNKKIDINTCNWNDYYTGNFFHPPYVPDGMTADELKNIVSLAHRLFYFRFKIIIKILKEITVFSEFKHLWNRGRHLLLK